jgi:hypothetical protein
MNLSGTTTPVGANGDSTTASTLQQREVRNRERTWLALFSWDRGLATVSGRTSWTMRGDDPTVKNAEMWCLHPLAASVDRQVSARAALRKTLGRVQDTLKEQGALDWTAAPSRVQTSFIISLIDNSLEPWAREWLVHHDNGKRWSGLKGVHGCLYTFPLKTHRSLCRTFGSSFASLDSFCLDSRCTVDSIVSRQIILHSGSASRPL